MPHIFTLWIEFGALNLAPKNQKIEREKKKCEVQNGQNSGKLLFQSAQSEFKVYCPPKKLGSAQ
jgi:hypothetical protein